MEKWEGEENSNQEEISLNTSNRKGKGLEVDKLLEFLERKEGQMLKAQQSSYKTPTKTVEENQEPLEHL